VLIVDYRLPMCGFLITDVQMGWGGSLRSYFSDQPIANRNQGCVASHLKKHKSFVHLILIFFVASAKFSASSAVK